MSPLIEFARGELEVDFAIWYKAKVAIAGALLRQSSKFESFAAAAEVVNETLLRIRLGQGEYIRAVSVEGIVETIDAFMLRCMQKTIASMRSQDRKAARRKVHDESVRLLHHREHIAREPKQEEGLAEEQAQRQIDAFVRATNAGPLLREQASNTLKWGKEKRTNEEIAILLKTKVSTVDKNRSRLAALVEARVKATEVSK